MKTPLHALIFLFAASIPQAFAGGILVFDATAKLENVRQWAKEAKQWMETAQHYKDQIQAYKSQLATATGVRDIADFVVQAKSLKADLEKLRKPGQALNDLLLSGGSSGQFDALYEKYKIFDTCNAERSGNYANVCKQQVINKAIQLEQTDEIQNQVSQTLGEINSLSNRVALAKDSKESQDLANSIQLKSVMLNTLTTQWEMSVKAAEKRENELEAERVKQWNQQQLNAPDINFN
ncbi:type IV secretion system protein VirB5 [Salmonella enterica subsp. enterica serovar Abaetetuba]|uniref:Type IV secretion system protein VirB5 n=1 Tax=Salmonella enterica subsp. houtenae serovar 45:g,z51:- TaxID=1967611 RepID=A0A753BAY6_SALHO|nr:type IV secretion system protein [Salmonella enterica]EAP4147319.1 type IV secretion system protein VirB5 [Salmonella enterica subsp. enterica serovar Anatum]EBV5808167.1 type IV secretion system protein VirB5 [Salmonella enterica subsp. enterica serovar Abaetetuba]EDP9653594.1 type IV secretion system protein VirB5 [Salmonella enterica subsp. enterica serovar Minnesota]HAF7989454.1 type IV secretion system protein VirB5 [Salmonella enterica subsp. houtenae serovar 45:g,z51:-]EBV7996032.1 t